ncbi:MAG TPA: YggS family pyridoxal phosphate-dependent enzyme [Bacteroidetes bacterium]|jgi:pyridoxal phosphate enzyme (YggS family)|nr:YggS family pyridoxal phosphate-dependent enzyme [Bacteroidota bacterium]
MHDLELSLRSVHERLNSALSAVSRPADAVRLMLATKMQSVETLRAVAGLGEHLFGENRVQELVPKTTALADLSIEWHFIGHLQTNKVKDVVGRVQCIQSVDRASLVEALSAECIKKDTNVNVMIEVNTSFEASKHGCHPDAVEALIDMVESHDRLRIAGFMTIGALSDDESVVRKGFAMLRQIRDRFDAARGTRSELSMGMSHDLEWAVAEGSTVVRVGTAVFGART